MVHFKQLGKTNTTALYYLLKNILISTAVACGPFNTRRKQDINIAKLWGKLLSLKIVLKAQLLETVVSNWTLRKICNPRLKAPITRKSFSAIWKKTPSMEKN